MPFMAMPARPKDIFTTWDKWCKEGQANHTLPSPHSSFYLSGESVVFNVENTLFRVDPALFTSGEDSAFKTMLSLPQGDNISYEGNRDVSPIILRGDTPAQFEMLLLGLHSQKIFEAQVTEHVVDRYVQLAKISHKYDIRSLEAWATSGLARLAQDNELARISHAATLLDLFCLCDCTDATNLIFKTVKEILNTESCSVADIVAFINIGQRYGSRLPSLASRGYYAMMLKPRKEWEFEATFSKTDRYRLLNGYYLLSEDSTCYYECIKFLSLKFADYYPSLGSSWYSYVIRPKEEEIRKLHNLRLVDIVGRLRILLETFLRETPAVPFTSNIKEERGSLFRIHLERAIDDLFETKLPLYFEI